MAPRQSTTFIKRQKELARQEKQRAKAARKLQRKAGKLAGTAAGNDADSYQTGEGSEPQQEGSESP